MSVAYRPGGFCDVAVLPDGRFVHVYESAIGVTEEWDNTQQITPAPERLMFCRAAVRDGNVVSIHQGHDTGRALLVTRGIVHDLGPTFGVQPVAIDATYVYIVRSNQSYDRIALATGEIEHLPHGMPGSSQGIRDVANGHVFWADEEPYATLGGIVMHEIARVDSLALGQADPSQIAGWNFATMQPFTAILGEAYEPHAIRSGDKYAICARTPKGAAFTIVPPFPAFINSEQPHIPEQPKPEDPKPVPVQNRASQLADFHNRWNGGDPIADDTDKHRFTAAFAMFLNVRDGDTRWGRKARAGTDAVSKDTLGYWLRPLVPHNPTDGKIDAFDIIASSGSVSWDTRAEQNDPGYRSIDARWFPVAAVSPQDPAPVPPQPPVTPDYERRLKAVEDAVSAIEAANSAERVAVAQLGEALKSLVADERDVRLFVDGAPQTFTNSAHQRLDALEARKYRATGTTSRDFGHSHRINVTLEPIS